MSTHPSRADRVVMAWAAYERNELTIIDDDLRGWTHILASRQGLFAVNETGCKLIARGFFFGVTLRGADIFVFESGDQPRGPTRRGRIVQLRCHDGRVTHATVLLKGLDNGCHQIDFIDGRLHVVDTYNQQIVVLSDDMQRCEVQHPLPRLQGERWGERNPEYVHVNSLLQIGDWILLLLHNGAHHTGRQSEVKVYDRAWKQVETWQLEGQGCHGLALLPDGRLLSCGSMAGELISSSGDHWPVGDSLTRGLAVGEQEIAVGLSPFAGRDVRDTLTGEVAFLDPNFKVRSRIEVPCAPTELRRLDSRDASQSLYLRDVPWGSTLPAYTHHLQG